ncbi:LA_2444/LA_4059 family outer membrane protein [Leptospira bandrabouensis]|nr:LA_2444/LA_4059 family outer membrane protein [Leptospira bandrabouensis]
MKKQILTTTLIFLTSVIYGQTKTPTIESGIRIQHTEFIPYDYSRRVTDADPYWGIKVNKLRNNTKTINPFFLIYKNFEKGFSLEVDYSKIQIERANYDTDFILENQISRRKNYSINNERSDLKFNAYFHPNQQFSELFAFGLGIRKIDRIRNASDLNYSIEEKFISLGPQIVFKSKIPITEQLSFNLGIDLYHTQGKRHYNYSSLFYSPSDNYSYVETVKGNGNTIGIFRGFETNLSLKYNFLENFNIAIGYNYNYSYLKYENLNDFRYYSTSIYRTIEIQNTKYSNGKELIRGFFISASTVF